MSAASTPPGAFTISIFGAAVVLGGANFVAVSFSNQELPPFWGAGLRFTLAGLIFVIISLASRLKWPRGRTLWITALYGVLTFAVSYALMYWALLQVSAGMAAVVLAIVPLVTLLLAAAHGLERIRRRSVMGGVVALGGILWMTISPEGFTLPVAGLVAMLAAALSVGESVIVSKRISGNHPAVTNAVGMAVGAPLLLALSAVAGERWLIPSQPEVVLSVLYLVTLGSVGLFVSFLVVIRKWTASATAYAFVLFPIVALLLDSLLRDAPLTARDFSGALIVMSGVWLGVFSDAGRKKHPRAGLTAEESLQSQGS